MQVPSSAQIAAEVHSALWTNLGYNPIFNIAPRLFRMLPLIYTLSLS
jgi:hypothetical protein